MGAPAWIGGTAGKKQGRRRRDWWWKQWVVRAVRGIGRGVVASPGGRLVSMVTGGAPRIQVRVLGVEAFVTTGHKGGQGRRRDWR
jgi:hypothetical protein